MSDAQVEKTTIAIEMNNSPVSFNATGEVVPLRRFRESTPNRLIQKTARRTRILYRLSKAEWELNSQKIMANERYTTCHQGAAPFWEGASVKKLEESGIGRPSTYAPTISTIQNRGYVSREDRPGEKRKLRGLVLADGKITATSKVELSGKEKSKLFPKDIGMIVNDFLLENFTDIVDFNFTADVEEEFDEIAIGNLSWTGMLDKFYSSFHKTVESTLEKKDKKTGVRILGNHPESGEPVSVKMGRYGPVVQIGDSSNEGKPRFASLLKDQLIETITLDEALNLFRLPRSLGIHDGEEMVVGIGKFGPYVRYRSKFYSLKKGVDDPYTVTPERAFEIIKEKSESDKQKVIHDFGDIQVLNGRYGPYITFDKKNFRIPRGTDAAGLTKDECKTIIDNNSKSKQ
ncbi:MAG: topoisomerase C-terminal repeat-containing protein [Bacteroidales bacterium]